MPAFERCCCYSVRTGSLLIGWWGLLMGFFFLGIASSQLVDRNTILYIQQDNDETLAMIYVITVGLTKMAAHVMLLYGIYREVPVLVKAWLIIFTLHELVYLFSVIVMWDIWFNLFFKLNIVLNIIFFLCVYSFYQEMVDL